MQFSFHVIVVFQADVGTLLNLDVLIAPVGYISTSYNFCDCRVVLSSGFSILANQVLLFIFVG